MVKDGEDEESSRRVGCDQLDEVGMEELVLLCCDDDTISFFMTNKLLSLALSNI